jgi:hypothetical protein
MTLPTITASTEQLSSYAKSMLTNTTNSYYFNITNIPYFHALSKNFHCINNMQPQTILKNLKCKNCTNPSHPLYEHCRALSLSTFYCPSNSSSQSFSNKSFPATIFIHLPVIHSCILNYDFTVHAYYQQSKLFLAKIKDCDGDCNIGISQGRLVVLSTTNTNYHYVRTK